MKESEATRILNTLRPSNSNKTSMSGFLRLLGSGAIVTILVFMSGFATHNWKWRAGDLNGILFDMERLAARCGAGSLSDIQRLVEDRVSRSRKMLSTDDFMVAIPFVLNHVETLGCSPLVGTHQNHVAICTKHMAELKETLTHSNRAVD